MKSTLRFGLVFGTVGLAGSLGCAAAAPQGGIDEASEAIQTQTFANAKGRLEVHSLQGNGGNINTTGPFFQNLGTNGRTCNSCHKLDASMGISVAQIQALFTQTNGLDPIFRINDGSNAPTGFYSQTDTVDHRRTSFSMLLAHGVIRVGIGMPAGADFTLAHVNDGYGFASAAELSLFRRPLPSINVAFNSHTMWDGRESEGGRTNNLAALINQANDATTGHAQRATPLDTTTRTAIANFQLNLFAGQVQSNLAGSETVAGCDIQAPTGDDPGAACEPARGGGVAAAAVFQNGNDDFPGAFTRFDGTSPASATRLNDPLPLRAPNPAIAGVQLVPAATHNQVSFIIFEPWESATLGPNPTVGGVAQSAAITTARGDIGDGENLFYNTPFKITNVPGLNGPNDGTNAGKVIQGTCSTCHSNPDVGNHSRARFFNIGIADPNPGNVSVFNMADFPQYTFRNSAGAQVTFTDPGLALRTGKFADLGKFKVPQLRGLANRAPYFHNGAANSLTDVVNFYNRRFNIGFTAAQIAQVVKFLEQT
jgi:hypothetical protein